jgi:hypothetical protein
MLPGLKTITLLGIGALCTPAFGVNPARPGTVNYIEGAAFLEGKPLKQHDVGTIDMEAGQILTTTQGKAEILLTPGVFLRLDADSAVKMITPNLTLTEVELERGRAAVEVDEVYAQNNIRVIDGGVATQLVEPGYYEFTADHPTAMVFTGKAAVEVSDGKYKVVKGHHELALAAGVMLKPAKFNIKDATDELTNWSSLRSQYLAEANNELAGEYAGMAGFNPGWYWYPYMWNYTFIGMDPYWSPFGFGFYPPWWGGLYGGGFYGGGYYGRGYYGRGGYAGRGVNAGRAVFAGHGAYAGRGMSGNGFHSGAGGGGFHGGGGGGFSGGGGGGFSGGARGGGGGGGGGMHR